MSIAHLSNAARARMMARIIAYLVREQGGEVRIPTRVLEGALPDLGIATQEADAECPEAHLLLVLGDSD